MRTLFSLLLVAVLVPAGAQALSAQQTYGNTTTKTTTKTTQTTHTRKHHRGRHTTATARHHARTRARVTTRTVTTMPEPAVLGTPASGFPMPAHAARMGTMEGSRLERLSSGLITPDAARRIALRTIPNGTSVNKIRLRTEDSRQVYDVKVITPNQTGNELVRVDAHTGAVVETKNVDNPVGTVKGAVNKAVNKVKHP